MNQTTQKNAIKENDDTIIEPEPPEKITEPFDPSKIKVNSKLMTVDLLLTRIDSAMA
jgi:hypothetical protein